MEWEVVFFKVALGISSPCTKSWSWLCAIFGFEFYPLHLLPLGEGKIEP